MVAEYFLDVLTVEQVAKAREWITALRSGTYQQGRRALRTASGFCCLGVACDLLDRGEWRSAPSAAGGTWWTWIDPVEGSFWSDMPPAAAARYGLRPKAQERLSTLNDDDAGSFSLSNIAAMLENDLKLVAVVEY